MSRVLFTVGHGTRSVAELVDLLKQNNVTTLVDVRTVPRSGTNPQHNKEALSRDLPGQHGVGYVWKGKELGGLRKMDKSSETNAGWDIASFRGYADYMQTQEFWDGLNQLMDLAEEQGPVAIMCAETVYFRCHRSLISDALTARRWQVLHIMSPGKPPFPHKLTKFARVQGEEITYPAYPHTPGQKGKRCGKEPEEHPSKAPKNAARNVGGAETSGKAAGRQLKIDAVFRNTRSAARNREH